MTFIQKATDKVKSMMPKNHKDLVYKMHSLLAEKKYQFFSAQVVTNLVNAAYQSGEEPAKALETAAEIAKLMSDEGVDKVRAQALLGVLASKLNEQINQTELNSIEITPIE